MKFLIVPGIHSKSKKGNMAKVAKELRKEGHSVREFPYPFRWSWQLWFKSVLNKDATRLLNFHQPGEIIISHSYGCLMCQEAFKKGLSCPQWFAFAGACTSDKMDYPDRAFKHAYCIMNPYDLAIKIGSKLWRHPIGKMGNIGYMSSPSLDFPDPRIVNINGSSSRWGLDHSHYWEEELTQWVNFICNNSINPKSELGILT